MQKWLASVVVFIVLGMALPRPGYSTHAEARIAQGQPVNDIIVSRWVRSALHADPAMRTGAINVASRSGHVTLKGFALNKNQAARAVEIARAVRGVKSVRDELVIMNRKANTCHESDGGLSCSRPTWTDHALVADRPPAERALILSLKR